MKALLLILVLSFAVFGQKPQQSPVTVDSLPDYKKDAWFLVPYKNDGIFWAINPTKVVNDGKDTLAWVKQFNINDLKNLKGTPEENSKKMKYSLLNWRVRCSTNQMQMLQHIDYDNGKVANTISLDKEEFKSVPPDTYEEIIMKQICAISELKTQNP